MCGWAHPATNAHTALYGWLCSDYIQPGPWSIVILCYRERFSLGFPSLSGILQGFPVASEGDALLRTNSFPFNSIHFAPYWISGSALVRPFGCQDTTSPAPSMRASMVTQRVPLQLTARRTPEHPGLVHGAQDQGASIQGNRSMDTEIARLRRRRKRPSMPSNCGRASCIGWLRRGGRR